MYIAEVVQAILLARLGYIQFGAGFGNFDAINAIPVILWFGVPVLNSIGTYSIIPFSATCHLLAYVYQWRPWSKFSMHTESDY